ncbi:MAG: hypothetical protein HND52_01405 [Ignavibacteriae bacterium]|jgi:hypothetical protein|nr:hypothetical protein [Ignavibacteriota bacterium]NOG96606.1 hypothetical protein [Ignavibacteriota bacterium]
MKNNGFSPHQILYDEKELFLKFMNEKYPIFFNSNIFFRDIQFALTSYFAYKEKPITYKMAEQLAQDLIEQLENNNELTKISNNSWRVDFHLEKQIENEEEKIKEEG